MQTFNYWKQFETTGKVEDYLKYVGGVETNIDTESEVIPNAGTYMDNRTDTETDAYR